MPAEQSVREQTKAWFGSIFRQKPKQPDQATTSKDSSDQKVEELERSLTKDDPLLESNTFTDEDIERKNSKNKKREEEALNGEHAENSKENLSSEDPKKLITADVEPENTEVTVKAETKKKKRFRFPGFGKKSEEPTDIELQKVEKEDVKTQDKPDVKEGEVEERVADQTRDNEQPSTSKDIQQVPPETEDKQPSSGEPVAKPRNLPQPSMPEEQSEDNLPKPTRRKRRRRGPRKHASEELAEANQETRLPEEEGPGSSLPIKEEEETPENNIPDQSDDGQVLGVTVHQSDHLQADLKYMSHPLVRVSVVDGATGSYLLKTSRSRHVSSYYETDDVISVLPIMTQPFDFRANQSVLPRWEETLIFNESFASMISQARAERVPAEENAPEAIPTVPSNTGLSPMLFFVIRDFFSMEKANNMRKGQDDVDKGWHTIAWAFLKLIGSNGKPNTGRKVRLQLFHPPRSSFKLPPDAPLHSEPAFFWWRNQPRQTYPSTLYVTLKAVIRPEEMDPACRSMFAIQPECGLQTYKQLHQSLQFADGSRPGDYDKETPKWSRLPGQACKIPNSVMLKLWSGSDGAFTIRFSNNGLRLAIACKHETMFPILLYGIPGGEEMGVLIGHQQLVYDIQWSNNDEKVVTSSGDGTAQVWDLNDKSKATHTLPHPAYVYTASFHPTAQHLVATGGYDSVVRVWSIATSTAQMLQELDGHKAFINSLTFDFTGLSMYSVDSAGVIIAWNCHSHEKPKKNNKSSWSLKTKYIEKELNGICINSVQVHKSNNKLLLHCKDSTIRMLDIRIHTLLRYNGSVNHRQLLRSALTPCGSFVVSGSEDGCAYVWNAESGDQVAIYNELGYSRPVRDITFHPHDHLVAFCCFSPNMPVLVFKYDKDAATLAGGLIAVVGSLAKKSGNEEAETKEMPSISATSGLKVDRIKRQLDSVLPDAESSAKDNWLVAQKMIKVAQAADAFADGTFNEAPSSVSQHRRPVSPATGGQLIAGPSRYDMYGSYGPNSSLSTWGSTFDATMQSSVVAPSFMSPHASPETRILAQHLAASQTKQDNYPGWKPTFAAVGGSPYRSDQYPPPEVSLTVDDEGNKSLRITSSTSSKQQKIVVALYDYQANRSDELTMMRNDLIKVLYQDGPVWWFGERITDQKQGYFPSNYVAMQGDESVDSSMANNSPEALFGVPSMRPDSAGSEPSKPVHALKMLSGKLQFYSQSESEGDDDAKKASLSINSRQRRRQQRLTEVKKAATSDFQTDSLPTLPESSSSLLHRQSIPEVTESPPPRKLPVPSPRRPASKSRDVNTTITDDNLAKTESKSKDKKARKKERRPSAEQSAVDPVASESREPEPEPDIQETIQEPLEAQPNFNSSRQHFGVLKAIQAKLAENDSFSSSVVGGSEFSNKPRSTRLDPILTSTASKPKRSRSRMNRSQSRNRQPKDTVGNDDAAIPMLELDREGASGISNLAYDNVSEV